MTDDDPFKRERPKVLSGPKTRIQTGWGKMYVGINEDEDGEPFEVFVTIGKSGGLYSSMGEALGKTISNTLRMSDDPRAALREVAEDLDGIRSGEDPHVDNGDMVYSIPDGIAIVLFRYLDNKLDPIEPVRGDAPGADLIREATGGPP